MIYTQFRIKRYLPIFFSIFISTIFLSNCARLPKPSIKNKTILVVKDEFVNTSSYPPQIRIKFNIKSSNGLGGNFYVMPSNGNAIISSLEPGNYNISGYTRHAIGQVTPKKNKTYPLRLKFELKNNQITVLNRKIVAKQKPYNSRGGWSFNMNTKNVTDSEKQEVINLLRKDENFSLWRIYEEKKYVQKPKPVPVPEPKIDKGDCGYRFYVRATEVNTVKSFRNFLNKCNDPGSSYYSIAYRTLNNKLKTKKSSPVKPSVVLPKVTVPTPKITDQSKKPQTIIIPTGSLGKMNESRIKILEKTLESKLDDYFSIVPKDLYEEAENQVWDELDSDECTVEQCNMMIREFLQVENSFQMNLIVDEGDTQISITWNDQDQKRVEEDYCEGCGTRELRKMIGGLVEKLVKGKN
jgi:hypothetical protein